MHVNQKTFWNLVRVERPQASSASVISSASYDSFASFPPLQSFKSLSKEESDLYMGLADPGIKKLISDHKLTGLIFSEKFREHRANLNHSNLSFLQSEWKSQWMRNQIFMNEAKVFDSLFKDHSVEVTALKGLSLLGELYEDYGARFMCDMDLLIEPRDLPIISEIFEAKGYTEVLENKWEANSFKKIYQKNFKDGVCVNFEFHTRLFYQNESNITWKKRKLKGFEKINGLDFADQLVHLLGHLGYQHTFISLHWLVDIDRFIRKYGDVCGDDLGGESACAIDWNRVSDLLTLLHQKRSARICFYLLVKYLDTPVESAARTGFFRKILLRKRELARLERLAFSKIFTSEFLLKLGSPQMLFSNTDKGRYYLAKHLSKDRLSDSLGYDFRWAVSRLLR